MISDSRVNSHTLLYKDNEQAWRLIGSPDTFNCNEAGELEVIGKGMAVNTERAYGDCVISAK